MAFTVTANNSTGFGINLSSVPQNINVGQVTETDLSQSISKQKRITVGQATETNLAQAAAKSKSKAIAQVSENETAQAIGRSKNISVDQSTSSDSAQSLIVFGRKNISVVQVTETDLAYEVSKSKSKSITQTTETDLSQNISKQKSKTVIQTTETDSASEIIPEQPGKIFITGIEETDTAFAIIPIKMVPVSAAEETEFAQDLAQILKRANISFAEEIETALPVGDPAPILIEVAVVIETDIASKIIFRTFDINQVDPDNITAILIEDGILSVIRDNGIISVQQEDNSRTILIKDDGITEEVTYNVEARVIE